MKGKNCLIFGGSGQIGRHLIRKLTKNDYRVIVVTRNIHQKGHIKKPKEMQVILILLRQIFLMKIKLKVYLKGQIFV